MRANRGFGGGGTPHETQSRPLGDHHPVINSSSKNFHLEGSGMAGKGGRGWVTGREESEFFSGRKHRVG